MKVTNLKELAQILDLSVSSVSKALKNRPDISLETRSRVKALAKEYGYVPNVLAQNLKSGKTRTIGVIIPNVLDEFFGMVLQGIEKQAAAKNYKIVICISDDKKIKEKDAIETLINGSVDGVLISIAKETQNQKNIEHLNRIVKHGTPIVQFDRVMTGLECDMISVDDFNAAFKATKHLMNTGCKRIAFITPISGTSVGGMRKEGYLQALNLKGGNLSKPIVIEIKNYTNFMQALRAALNKNKIDGILAADELSAIYAINTIQSLELMVPTDVSVIGFTNGMLAKCSNPTLTTVSQHAFKMGKKAVNQLIKRIEYPKRETDYIHSILKTDLTVRNSTKKINTATIQ